MPEVFGEDEELLSPPVWTPAQPKRERKSDVQAGNFLRALRDNQGRLVTARTSDWERSKTLIDFSQTFSRNCHPNGATGESLLGRKVYCIWSNTFGDESNKQTNQIWCLFVCFCLFVFLLCSCWLCVFQSSQFWQSWPLIFVNGWSSIPCDQWK